MNQFAWDERVDRRGTQSVKWDALKTFIGADGLMPFWVADTDFLSPKAVIEVLTERAAHGVFGYTADDGMALDAYLNWVSKRHGVSPEKEWLTRTPGVVTAIGIAIQAFTQKGDGVVITPPVYPQFLEMVQINERQLWHAPLLMDSDGRPYMDFEAIETLFKNEHPKMMIFCSPHNPLGRIWSPEEVMRLCELCVTYDVLLFSDEIHCDLLFPDRSFYSALHLPTAIASRLIVAMAPSKTFNIAGLGYALVAIPDPTLRKAFRGIMNGLHISATDCFNEAAAKAAYEHGGPWLDSLMIYLEQNYRQLADFIRAELPKVKVCPMDATYLAWLDFNAYFETPEALKVFMIEEAGIAVNDGRAFGPGGEGFVRFNFGCSTEAMLEGLNAIHSAMQRKGLL